jgi:hypothetical protein
MCSSNPTDANGETTARREGMRERSLRSDGFVGRSYSVHTSAAALRRGEEEIRRMGARLLAEGKRSYALEAYGDARVSRSLAAAER